MIIIQVYIMTLAHACSYIKFVRDADDEFWIICRSNTLELNQSHQISQFEVGIHKSLEPKEKLRG